MAPEIESASLPRSGDRSADRPERTPQRVEPLGGTTPAPRPVTPIPSETFSSGHNDAPHTGKSRWWIWLVLAIVVAGGGYWWWHSHHASAANTNADAAGPSGRGGARVTPVVTATARIGEIPIYFDGLGTVTALNTVTVRARVDGQVDSVNYVEGQIVKQGDLLAQIDPRPFEVQLTQAQGQLARDQSLLKNAQVDYQRYLEAQDAIPKQQLDTQKALVSQYEAAIKIDQGQVANANLQLTYSRVTAPFTGRIGLRQVDPGNIIHANDANGIAVIIQVQPIAVVFTLPQDQIPQVVQRMNAADPPQVQALDRDRKSILATGTLMAIDNQVDPNSGTIRLKATFANEDAKLFPNQFVNARLLVATRSNAIIVPAAAIQRGPEGMTFVYVVKADETVEVRNITAGPTEGERTVIEQGLAEGEVVVTDGVDKLQNGAKVSARARASTRPGADGQNEQGGGRGVNGMNRPNRNGASGAATTQSGTHDRSAANPRTTTRPATRPTSQEQP